MNPRRQAAIHQQQRVSRKASNTDAYAFFNLLTSPELFDCVEKWSEGQVLPFALVKAKDKTCPLVLRVLRTPLF